MAMAMAEGSAPPPSSSAASAPTSRLLLAYAEARDAFRRGLTRPLEWRLRQLDALATCLLDRQDDINRALHDDLGKSPFESFCTEAGILLNSLRTMRNNLKRWAKPQKVGIPLPLLPGSGEVVAEPLGVVLVFSAWNFPLVLALDPVIGAIAAGNAVVLKCSEVAPSVAKVLSEVIPMYLDNQAIKVVEGGAPEGEELLKQKWDKIFFTGGAHVGKIVMTAAAKHLTPVTLELGGKSPCIVDSGVDLKVVTRRIASGKWGINSGQTCLAPDYVIVERKNAQKLIKEFEATLKEFFGTDLGFGSSPDLTRIVNKRHFSRLTSYLTDSDVDKTIVYGGKSNQDTFFLEPTILLDPPLDAPVMNEEIFGPILPIITVYTISEAIDFVNSKNKPLALYLFTNDKELKARVTKETSTGNVVINDTVVQFALDMIPFGGVGDSGMGAYHGKYSFESFSHMKPIVYRSLWGDADIRYPPYNSSKKQSIVRHIVRMDYLGLLLVLLGFRR